MYTFLHSRWLAVLGELQVTLSEATVWLGECWWAHFSYEAADMELGEMLLVVSRSEMQSVFFGSKVDVQGMNLKIKLKLLGLAVAERPRWEGMKPGCSFE